MFWDSIWEGIKTLGHWQVWLAVIIYMILSFLFLYIISKISGEDEYGGRAASGCLFYIIGGTAFHGMLMSIMISILLPILLGHNSTLPLGIILSSLWPIIKVGLIAIVAVTIISFIPLIGSFIANSPGIQGFIEGVIIFRLLSVSLIYKIMTQAELTGRIYPTFWQLIGFLIIAGILVKVIMFIVAFATVPFEDSEFGELIPILIGPVLGVLGGLIPLFMYSSFVRLSIQNLL